MLILLFDFFALRLLTCCHYQDIDLVHCRISSIPALNLERFNNVEVRCHDQLTLGEQTMNITDLELGRNYAFARTKSHTSNYHQTLARHCTR